MKHLRALAILALYLFVAGCSNSSATARTVAPSTNPTSTAVSSRAADVARVLSTLATLEGSADAMAKSSGLGVLGGASAKAEYAAIVSLARSEYVWAEAADLPTDLRASYERLLNNLLLNAGRLTDGSDDGFFRFLATSLVPKWTADMATIREAALVLPK